MEKNRLEAFSDGVIAIIVTIMVLELHVPHTTDIPAPEALLPVFLSCVLSFIYMDRERIVCIRNIAAAGADPAHRTRVGKGGLNE